MFFVCWNVCSCSEPLNTYMSTVSPAKWEFPGCVSDAGVDALMRASRHWRSGRSSAPPHSHTRITVHEAKQHQSSATSNTYTMGLCISTTSHLRSAKRIGQCATSGHFQSNEGIDQDAIGGEPPRQRYAPFSCNVIRLRVNMADA